MHKQVKLCGDERIPTSLCSTWAHPISRCSTGPIDSVPIHVETIRIEPPTRALQVWLHRSPQLLVDSRLQIRLAADRPRTQRPDAMATGWLHIHRSSATSTSRPAWSTTIQRLQPGGPVLARPSAPAHSHPNPGSICGSILTSVGHDNPSSPTRYQADYTVSRDITAIHASRVPTVLFLELLELSPTLLEPGQRWAYVKCHQRL